MPSPSSEHLHGDTEHDVRVANENRGGFFWSMDMTHEERHELECLVQRAREAGRMMLADKLRAFLNDEDQFELSASEWIAAATNMIAR